jgi:gluconolactonase
VFCDCNTGELLAYADGSVRAYSRTGGSPWGAVLGSDGAIYVTQGGNVPGSGDTSAVSGIQRVLPGGTASLLFSQVAGHPLYGPNDLAFGPDGRLWFTESGSEQDVRFDVRSPGRIFAVTRPVLARCCLNCPASARTASRSTRSSGCTGPSR